MKQASSSLDTDLYSILDDIERGKWQLPDFQRSWTWDDTRIRNIIVTLSQGYPMGAIMCLKTGNEEIQFQTRTIEGVADRHVKPEILILDGQQRLTSIYNVVHSPNAVKTTNSTTKKVINRYYYLDIKKCLDPDSDRFDAIVAVPEDRKIKTNFDRDVVLDISTPEKEFEHKMFPLNIVFDGNARENWCFAFGDYYNNTREIRNLYTTFRNDVLDTIQKYKLPVITLGQETPREAVCKVFENVNTGGVALSVFELVTAAFAMHGFKLREDWEQVKLVICGATDNIHTDIFDGIDNTTYLTAMTLYTSYDDKTHGQSNTVSCKKKDVLSLSYDSYINNKPAVLDGFNMAREFLLQYQCVYRRYDLPYTTQIIPLSVICAIIGRSIYNAPNTKNILSKWYWCGILGEMYGGANETRYANDVEDIVDEIQGRPSLNRTINAASFSASRLLTLQTRLSAAYKGILALLYKEKCRDFRNDTTIDVVHSVTECLDIHHIFPEAYCKKENIPRSQYNSIVNKTAIIADTNRAIGGHAPSTYLNYILNHTVGMSEVELKSRVESLLINYDLLKSDKFDAYFIDRAKRLLDLIEKVMGKKVSDRGSEETIKQFGESLE